MDENRPALCRNRLKDEGKPHPRSGCNVCRNGGMMGCPHERAEAKDHSAPTRGEVTQGDRVRAASIFPENGYFHLATLYGKRDAAADVQAFAAHRLAAIEEAAKVMAKVVYTGRTNVPQAELDLAKGMIDALRNLGRGV